MFFKAKKAIKPSMNYLGERHCEAGRLAGGPTKQSAHTRGHHRQSHGLRHEQIASSAQPPRNDVIACILKTLLLSLQIRSFPAYTTFLNRSHTEFAASTISLSPMARAPSDGVSSPKAAMGMATML